MPPLFSLAGTRKPSKRMSNVEQANVECRGQEVAVSCLFPPNSTFACSTFDILVFSFGRALLASALRMNLPRAFASRGEWRGHHGLANQLAGSCLRHDR